MYNYKAVYWVLALLLCGCHWPGSDPEIQASELNYGYGLLYGVVSQEQDVDKILWIKNVSPELHEFIGETASLSGKVTAELESWKESDPTLILSATGLPEVEVKTRSRIAEHKTIDLLGSWGPHFERDLILTQLEALNYMAYLMETLATKDPQNSRHSFLKENSKAFLVLRDKMQALLEVASVNSSMDGEQPIEPKVDAARTLLPGHRH